MRDEGYKSFNARLIPNIDSDKIIGVRTPQLRKYAKELAKTDEGRAFIAGLPHEYYEENNIHAYIIETIKDFDTALCETERFLPYIDNWATCDTFIPNVFKKNRDRLIPKIKEWIASDKVYTVRYAIGLLLRLYLDDCFNEEYLRLAADVRTEEYYINMMIAWYFAEALAKQYSCAVIYIEEKRLPVWVHNKAIQKAVESRRISAETKEYLKSLKVK